MNENGNFSESVPKEVPSNPERSWGHFPEKEAAY